MEKRVSYYVSRKSFLVWLSALVMTASAALRIAYSCGKGADASTVWFQIVLPVAACLIFVLMILLGGEERFYRTAIPAFMLAIYYSVRVSSVLPSLSLRFVFWVAYLAMAGLYRRYSLRPPAQQLGAGSAAGCRNHSSCLHAPHGLYQRQLVWPRGLFAGASVFDGRLFCRSCHAAARRRKVPPHLGDRVDGRKLRTLDPVQIVANYIMPTRVGSSNFVRDSVEITAMERYIREKRRAGLTSFGITHVFLAAYVRTVAKYPALNRFLSGQQVYSRGDDIQFCMMVKEDMTTDAAESAMKLHLTPTDSVEDIYRKMNEQVTRIKEASDASDFDKTAKLLSLIPGIVFKFVVWLLKVADYFGLLPKFLLEVSPFHGSIFFTSMGSLGIPPIVHHLYDFGNLPVFCAFGCKYRKNEIDMEGNLVQRKYIDFTVNTDERICDGFYFATALKHMKKLLQHPERLDEPLDEVVKDVD
ncbi:MAG: hypothetical protein ACLR8U_02310 [Oscillospiraceae bacterium]